MKRALRNLLILLAFPILLASTWNIQASEKKLSDNQIQATPSDTLRSPGNSHTDTLWMPQGLRVPQIDTLRHTPGNRNLLLRPADKKEYTVRDLLFRPEDQLRYSYIDTLSQTQEKPK